MRLRPRLTRARGALSREAQAAVWAAGQTLSVEQAVADDLDLEDVPAPSADPT
jgi:hypothetical protein